MSEQDKEPTIQDVVDCVPTSWLDPILTGPGAVKLDKCDERQVEILVNAIKCRVQMQANELDAALEREQSHQEPVNIPEPSTPECVWRITDNIPRGHPNSIRVSKHGGVPHLVGDEYLDFEYCPHCGGKIKWDG